MRVRPWRFGLVLLLFTGVMPGGHGISAEPAAAAKRRGPFPTAKDVQNAFQSKADGPRANLYLKLRRAAEAIDQPAVVAALVSGLDRRIEKQTIDGADLRLISLLGGSDAEGAEAALRRYLRLDDSRIVILALQGLTESKRLPDWNEIAELTRRDDYAALYALRRGLIAAAETTATRDSVDYLVATVRQDDGQLKYEAARALMGVTGQSFGGQGEKWQAWWKDSQATFEPLTGKDRVYASLQKEIPWDRPVPRFYQLPVYARRVLFMIDRSGSMKLADENGDTRIDRARRELADAIFKLPVDAEFDIVAFENSVTAFSPRLVKATTENKQLALYFIQQLRATGDTNCYDALSMALDADPNLEAIYLLSDGEPTTGGIVEPPKIVDAVGVQNQLRHTALYTLGIDARGEFRQFLQSLAERNYGEFFLIR